MSRVLILHLAGLWPTRAERSRKTIDVLNDFRSSNVSANFEYPPMHENRIETFRKRKVVMPGARIEPISSGDITQIDTHQPGIRNW